MPAPNPRKRERPPPAAGASRGLYVYCVIESDGPLRFGPIGVGATPSEVYTVHYENLAAVVSDAPPGAFDMTRENILAHERVNEAVLRSHTVIPMSFGTVFRTREDIVGLLRSAAQAFGDALDKMRNKLEFGLHVFWDRDRVIGEAERQDAERFAIEILGALREVSVASRVNKPIGDGMIMNAAFLIARDQEAAFERKIKSVAGRFDKLAFKYTGPWPPYNFVNIRLKLERA